MGKFTLSLKGRKNKSRLLSPTVGAASRGCSHIRSQEQVGKKLTLDLTLALTEQNPNPSQAQRCVAGSMRCAPRAMSASMRVAAQASAVCDVPAASLRAVRSSAALCAARMSASSRHHGRETVVGGNERKMRGSSDVLVLSRPVTLCLTLPVWSTKGRVVPDAADCLWQSLTVL